MVEHGELRSNHRRHCEERPPDQSPGGRSNPCARPRPPTWIASPSARNDGGKLSVVIATTGRRTCRESPPSTSWPTSARAPSTLASRQISPAGSTSTAKALPQGSPPAAAASGWTFTSASAIVRHGRARAVASVPAIHAAPVAVIATAVLSDYFKPPARRTRSAVRARSLSAPAGSPTPPHNGARKFAPVTGCRRPGRKPRVDGASRPAAASLQAAGPVTDSNIKRTNSCQAKLDDL